MVALLVIATFAIFIAVEVALDRQKRRSRVDRPAARLRGAQAA